MDTGWRQRSTEGTGRGGAEVLGFVLLFGISLLTIGVVVGVTAPMFDGAKETADVTRAETALGQLDSETSAVVFGDTGHRSVDLGLQLGASDATLETHGDAGRIQVDRVDGAAGTTAAVVNATLGAVVYERGDSVVAYQNGGIWRTRQNHDGSTMVSSPAFTYRDGTLILPLVSLEGEDSLSSRITVRQDGTGTSKAPSPAADLVNPVESGGLVITVQSEFYRAWGNYLERMTGEQATYDTSNDTVTVSIFAERMDPAVLSGLVADPDGTFTVSNNVDGDSYNSSAGNYSTTASPNLSVTSTADVVMENNIELEGDLEAAENVTFDNPNAQVTGNVSYGDTITPDGSNTVSNHVGGWNASNASVEPRPSVADHIDTKRQWIRDNNDNERAGAIDDSSNQLTSCDPQCELRAGRYYLDSIDLESDETLVLNTTGGDIEIVVAGDVTVDGGTTRLDDGNDHEVRFYVTGDLTLQSNKPTMTVPGERAPRQWVFMKPDAEATIENQAEFVGVVYGPGGDAAGTEISLSNQPSIYGALVGGIESIPNNAHLHYDEGLETVTPGGTSSSQQFRYVHVDLYRANVTN